MLRIAPRRQVDALGASQIAYWLNNPIADIRVRPLSVRLLTTANRQLPPNSCSSAESASSAESVPPSVFCPGALRQPRKHLLVTPERQPKRSPLGLQLDDGRPSSNPAVLFVEPGRPVVPDGAAQPGELDAAGSHPSFAIGNEDGRRAGPPSLRREVELVQLVAFHDTEAERLARRANDRRPACSPGSRLQNASSVRCRASSAGRIAACASCHAWYQDGREPIELRRIGSSDGHRTAHDVGGRPASCCRDPAFPRPCRAAGDGPACCRPASEVGPSDFLFIVRSTAFMSFVSASG